MKNSLVFATNSSFLFVHETDQILELDANLIEKEGQRERRRNREMGEGMREREKVGEKERGTQKH